jgi:hypothetical protein
MPQPKIRPVGAVSSDLAEKEKKNPKDCRDADQHPNHQPLAGHRRTLRGQPRLQYCRVLCPSVLDRGSTQFRIVKSGIDVNS